MATIELGQSPDLQTIDHHVKSSELVCHGILHGKREGLVVLHALKRRVLA